MEANGKRADDPAGLLAFRSGLHFSPWREQLRQKPRGRALIVSSF